MTVGLRDRCSYFTELGVRHFLVDVLVRFCFCFHFFGLGLLFLMYLCGCELSISVDILQ